MDSTKTFIFMLKVKCKAFLGKIKNFFWKFINGAKEMIANRPEIFLALIGIGAGIINKIFYFIKMRKTSKNLNELRNLKENFYYDSRKRHYVETRRKLNSKELLELDRRYSNGEDYSAILDSMRLLK